MSKKTDPENLIVTDEHEKQHHMTSHMASFCLSQTSSEHLLMENRILVSVSAKASELK